MWITTHTCNQYAVDCINGQHLSPTAIHGLPVKVGILRAKEFTEPHRESRGSIAYNLLTDRVMYCNYHKNGHT